MKQMVRTSGPLGNRPKESFMREFVREYYGEVLESSEDLKTDACCTIEDQPAYLSQLIEAVHPEVRARYYGCGLVIPEQLEGLKILDLGCGAGRDVYLLSQLVGADGSVVGVDMTEAQLETAAVYQDYHRDQFGYDTSNVAFHLANIEDLERLPLAPDSFDVVVSNCVMNLAERKDRVLAGAQRLLKPGGEFYFADVYADRRVPDHIARDEVLYGECLGGALYWNDFLSLAKTSGFADPRLVTCRAIEVSEPALRQRVKDVRFYSATYRLFKLDSLEPACEDYGQQVMYKGGILYKEEAIELDHHHRFERGQPTRVCGNTFDMLLHSRFRPFFDFEGDRGEHIGLFEGCGIESPFKEARLEPGGCC